MNRVKPFFFGLAVSFGLPWLYLIVLPHAELRSLEPISYDEEKDQLIGQYPPGEHGLAKHGSRVYRENGCYQCHTQMIRPTYLGYERWREGWAGRFDKEEKVDLRRETQPRDYLGEEYANLGVQRNGPDLSNVGWRLTDAQWHHLHLYNPRIFNSWSNMPSYHFLYKKQKIVGQPSEEALPLSGEYAPENGYEVVPTNEAKALVAYLLSLQKDYQIPAPKEETKE